MFPLLTVVLFFSLCCQQIQSMPKGRFGDEEIKNEFKGRFGRYLSGEKGKEGLGPKYGDEERKQDLGPKYGDEKRKRRSILHPPVTGDEEVKNKFQDRIGRYLGGEERKEGLGPKYGDEKRKQRQTILEPPVTGDEEMKNEFQGRFGRYLGGEEEEEGLGPKYGDEKRKEGLGPIYGDEKRKERQTILDPPVTGDEEIRKEIQGRFSREREEKEELGPVYGDIERKEIEDIFDAPVTGDEETKNELQGRFSRHLGGEERNEGRGPLFGDEVKAKDAQDNMPHTLWIWNVVTLKLYAVLIQISPIKAIEWDPTQERIALCTGNNKLYFWSVAGCVTVEVPTESEGSFQVNSLHWHPDGDNILLLSKDRMCLCFLTPSDS